jgi:hypothetical protein
MKILVEVDIVSKYIEHKSFYENVKNDDSHIIYMSQFDLFMDWCVGFVQQINSVKSPLSLVHLLTELLPKAKKDKEFWCNLIGSHFRVLKVLDNLTIQKQKKLAYTLIDEDEVCDAIEEVVTNKPSLTNSEVIIAQFELLLIMAWENLLPSKYYEDVETT